MDVVKNNNILKIRQVQRLMYDRYTLKLENNAMNCFIEQNLSLDLNGSFYSYKPNFYIDAVHAHLWNFSKRIIFFEKSKVK